MGTSTFAGCYRGVVEAVDDPDRRGRYRVRVTYVHPLEIETEHLPWAEVSGFGGRGFGDVPTNYDVGDLVWIMFEGGRREYPVVLGGWISRRDGIHDLSPDQVQDYGRNRQRWVRADRAGNRIEFVDVPGDEKVKVRSGYAIIELRKTDDCVDILTTGCITADAPRVRIVSTQTYLVGDDVIVQARGEDGGGAADGLVGLYASGEVRVYGANTTLIGQYVDDLGEARQSGESRLQARAIRVGVQSPSDGSKATLTVDVEGSSRVRLASASSVLIQCGGTVRIEAKRVEIVES